MSLLKGTNVIRAVTSHQCSVAAVLEAKQNLLFLLRRYTSVNPGMAKNLLPARLTDKFGEGVTGKTDILRIDDVGRQRLCRVDGDVDLVIDALPDKRGTGLIMFRRIEDVALAIDNLALLGDMDSGQRVVTSDHDNAVAGLIERTACLDSVGLERALEDEETSKVQIGLDLLTLEIIDAVLAPLALLREELVGKGEHTATVTGKVLERLFVVGRGVY